MGLMTHSDPRRAPDRQTWPQIKAAKTEQLISRQPPITYHDTKTRVGDSQWSAMSDFHGTLMRDGALSHVDIVSNLCKYFDQVLRSATLRSCEAGHLPNAESMCGQLSAYVATC